MPLNHTVFAAGVVPKFLPVKVTTVFTVPETGLIEAMVGGNRYVNIGPVDLPSGVVTTTSPVLPPAGARTFKKVELDETIMAPTPLKVTIFFKPSALNPVPVMVT